MSTFEAHSINARKHLRYVLFNSFTFFGFFILFFIVYWLVARNYRLQNLVVIAGGCIFYGWWDWRFLFLLFFSTIVGFVAAILIDRQSNSLIRKWILWITIGINLALLGFFKYFNFFIQSWLDLLTFFGLASNTALLHIVLPIGISFYSFQKLSYVIDVYQGKIKPSTNFIQFLAYVSFFPQLLAGPIERATTLLPQFNHKRFFSKGQASEGLQLIVYGLFKKVVVADNCAMFVNQVWQNHDHLGGVTLILGAVFFAFQIYGDFSGY